MRTAKSAFTKLSALVGQYNFQIYDQLNKPHEHRDSIQFYATDFLKNYQMPPQKDWKIHNIVL